MRSRAAKWIAGGIGVLIVVFVLAYAFVPVVRYYAIPIFGSVKAPEKLGTGAEREEARRFVPGTLANRDHVVGSIADVPAEGGWINTAPLDPHHASIARSPPPRPTAGIRSPSSRPPGCGSTRSRSEPTEPAPKRFCARQRVWSAVARHRSARFVRAGGRSHDCGGKPPQSEALRDDS